MFQVKRKKKKILQKKEVTIILFISPIGSPFICQVIDSRQVRVTGDGLEKTSVNRPASFLIDVQGQPSTLDVRVLSPSRRVVPSTIDTITESRYSVTYTPTEVGKIKNWKKKTEKRKIWFQANTSTRRSQYWNQIRRSSYSWKSICCQSLWFGKSSCHRCQQRSRWKICLFQQ